MKVCPSVLETESSRYSFQIEKLSGFFGYFQIDVSDGVFVKNKTAQTEEIIKAISQAVKKTGKKITFDFHLMVKDYESEIKKIEKMKNLVSINNIFVHLKIINNFKLDVLSFFSFPVGIALDPDDQVNTLRTNFNLEKIPFIQIMSVFPGLQGNPFQQYTLNKIEQLRKLNYRNSIYLDGGVNDKTLKMISGLKNRPDFICPGSYLTRCRDEEIEERSNYLLQF